MLTSAPYDIYYAHHQWKYGTPEEVYEISLIKRYFPNANIFNPATDLTTIPSGDETVIMNECLNVVRGADILVFSSLDGCVGTGVFHEVKEAMRKGTIVFYIYQDNLIADFEIIEREEFERTDRLYAFVERRKHEKVY